MEVSYQYSKQRRLFGKQCCFAADGPKLVEDLKPDRWLSEKYMVKNPVCKEVQVGYRMSENTTNTHVKDYNDRGMNHIEGGWPKEVDMNDDEAVLRFRKKVERLDNYIGTMQKLTKPMEHAILQNNAINIYERYFEESISAIRHEMETCRIQSKFKDPRKPRRPITGCSWSPEGGQFCVACGTTRFQSTLDWSFESFIWDVERPLFPEMTLLGDSPILCLEYNTRDPNWIIAGLYSGSVGHFDTRRGSTMVGTSPMEFSHREPTHSVLWINSKSGTEFFSTSNDGVVMWWDCRHLDNPIESIILDTSKAPKQSVTRAWPASCLEYEPSIPARYMVGTEVGYIINGNRKGISLQEKLPVVQKCHAGPVFSIHRNQGFAKNFLAVGEWSAKIWSEDCRESPIIWTKNYSKKLVKGEWSAARLSVFFLIREDGVLDVWDIIIDQENPTLSFKLSQHPLTAMRVMQDGLLLLAGDADGTSYVVRFSSNFSESSKNEKMFLSSMFERESRREKLLEGRNREIRLKLREVQVVKEPGQKTEFEIQVEKHKTFLENEYLAEVENTLQLMEEGKSPEKAVA